MLGLDWLRSYEVEQDYGWVVSWVGEGRLYPLSLGINMVTNKPYPINRWIKEKDYREDKRRKYLSTGMGEKYPCGFPVYLREEDAEFLRFSSDVVVRRVKFKEVVAKGFEEVFGRLCKVVVVKEMLILPERRKEKCA